MQIELVEEYQARIGKVGCCRHILTEMGKGTKMELILRDRAKCDRRDAQH